MNIVKQKMFPVAAFIGTNVDLESFEWEIDGKVWPNKTKQSLLHRHKETHRTHLANDKPIMNISKTWENVMKLMTVTRYF